MSVTFNDLSLGPVEVPGKHQKPQPHTRERGFFQTFLPTVFLQQEEVQLHQTLNPNFPSAATCAHYPARQGEPGAEGLNHCSAFYLEAQVPNLPNTDKRKEE